MEPIEFSKIVDWAKLRWEEAVSACQADFADFPQDYEESGTQKARRFFDCSFLMDSGTLKGEIPTDPDPRDNCQLKCLVSHSVGSQDSSANIETYAQTVKMEMRAPEDYRTFVTRIWERFATSLKSVSATIGGKNCVVTSDEMPSFGPKNANVVQNQRTAEGFNISFSFIVVAFSGPLLSNSYSVTLGIYDKVDGTKLIEGTVPFAQISYASTCGTTVNIDKETTKTNRQSFRTLLIRILAVLPDSAFSRALIADVEDGAHFGHAYKLSKSDSVSTTEKWLIVSKSAVTYVYGSFVSWEAELIPTR